MGRKELHPHYRGLSSFVKKMMYETASPLDPEENTTERADARENTVGVMETDGLVLSPGYCQGSRLKWALHTRNLIQWQPPSAWHAALSTSLPSAATESDGSEVPCFLHGTLRHSWHFPHITFPGAGESRERMVAQPIF